MISFEELEAKLRDPTVLDSEIRPFLMADTRDSGAFDPRVVPDPTKVSMDEQARFRVESVLRWGNAIARWRRQRRYEMRRAAGEKLPVLVSEGDSWFQFPFLIDDVVDHLGADHLIWSLDAAGDTAENMVFGRPEYLKALRERRPNNVAGFLFSAAGNDVIGEDHTGRPVLSALLKPYKEGQGSAWHVDQARFGAVLQFLEGCYRDVIGKIRAEDGFGTLPIILHGYDYAIPAMDRNDPRNPRHAAKNEWLGAPMDEKGIKDPELRKGIVRFLINGLYDMLNNVAGQCADTRVFVVDLRGTLQHVTDWADEIHGTSQGFAQIADRFRVTLREAGIGSLS